MFGLVALPYHPSADEMTILSLFHEGKTQTEIAKHFMVTEECIRQRTCQLRAKLGVKTNEQMMSHYGMWKQANGK